MENSVLNYGIFCNTRENSKIRSFFGNFQYTAEFSQKTCYTSRYITELKGVWEKMYRVLIVDDEMPALRFISSIIEQFSNGFHVAGTASSGELALEFLQKNTVDVLLTDISMHGMNGIELAQQARQMQPGIHIVIISGYGEFEYAQGAIQAGVDNYLLKPVSISKLSAVLQAIQKKMEDETIGRSSSVLPALACGQPYNKDVAQQLYGKKKYRFAYIRWGNLNMVLPKFLSATSMAQTQGEQFQVLRGRDGDECILLAEDQGLDDFLSQLSVYVTKPGNLATWTAVYTPLTRSFDTLPGFIELAINMIYQKTVIGKHQILQLSGGSNPERVKIPPADLKQLGYFVTSGKNRMVKNYFLTLASTWERTQMPQRQVWHMGRQIIHQVGAVRPQVFNQLDEILQEFNTLIQGAGSYTDMMTSLYAILFAEEGARDRKMSTQELYDSAVAYIRENYAQPLSMQSVCDEIGISQTYLSRLFRKYSDTTFNAFLTQCRMETAKKLLREKPDLLLYDVAACVGYEDSSYFTKVFRQYTGKTPSQWANEGK